MILIKYEIGMVLLTVIADEHLCSTIQLGMVSDAEPYQPANSQMY